MNVTQLNICYFLSISGVLFLIVAVAVATYLPPDKDKDINVITKFERRL